MSLEQRLSEKLRPHADRVAEGRHNEFDFLPAALLQGLEHGRTTSEAVTEFRAAISTNVVIFERHVTDAAKSQKESSQQLLEALDVQRRLILENFAAIDKCLNEAANKQVESKEKVSETLIAQGALVVERFAAIELQAREADKQQSESRAQMSEHTVSVQRRLDRTANEFNKQIGKLSDALSEHMDNSRKHHRAMQAVIYACSIFVVLTLAASIALLIKR